MMILLTLWWKSILGTIGVIFYCRGTQFNMLNILVTFCLYSSKLILLFKQTFAILLLPTLIQWWCLWYIVQLSDKPCLNLTGTTLLLQENSDMSKMSYCLFFSLHWHTSNIFMRVLFDISWFLKFLKAKVTQVRCAFEFNPLFSSNPK